MKNDRYSSLMRLYAAMSDLGHLAAQARIALQVLRTVGVDPFSDENFITMHTDIGKLWGESVAAALEHNTLVKPKEETLS